MRSGLLATLVVPALFALACTTARNPIPIVEPTVEPPPAAPPKTVPPPPPTTVSAPSVSQPPRSQPTAIPIGRDAGAATIRVALTTSAGDARISSSSAWTLYDRSGADMLLDMLAGEQWRIERDGHRLRAVRDDGFHTDWVSGPLLARSVGDGLLTDNGKRYRGDLLITAGDSGLVVVNRLAIDEYLRGVVPLEIGPRTPAESAAVQAQAVTARSYAFVHLVVGGQVRYDVSATVLDQVYGGVEAETPVGSQAVESTRGLVLEYAGKVVNAPYHSTCGGRTAEPQEIWRSGPEPYLQSVSDQIPGTGRYYCDISPQFHWVRTYDAPTLNATIARYLATYTAVPGGKPGLVRDLSIASQTPSGRVGTLTVSTERGNFVLRGNDIRFVLRSPGGEILNSTYFSVELTGGSDGLLSTLTLRGMGNGHGVGMCQWGAIGRARAGQDFRTILATYYPGTTVGLIP